MTKAWSSCSLPKVQRRTDREDMQSKNRDFQPRMFFVGGERSPVALFKQFVEGRPLNMRWSGPFYLSITNKKRRLNDNIWFKTQPMGENTISNMMKTTVAGTSLKERHKSSRITVLERQQSASWRKQTLNAPILWRSQASEAYNPLTITMKPTRKSNDDSPVQDPNKIMKTPVLRKSEWQFPTSQQLWLHSLR